MAKKRIGILTGGGDVPGLNAVIKTITYRSSENNIEVLGLGRGWEALTHLNLDDPASRRHYVIALDRESTRTPSTGAAGRMVPPGLMPRGPLMHSFRFSAVAGHERHAGSRPRGSHQSGKTPIGCSRHSHLLGYQAAGALLPGLVLRTGTGVS